MFDARYKFTAKELDNETSYTYFGARYYDSDLSVWISVDPMSDERSWVSPYAYCQNNPVVLVDPRGMLDDWYMNEETGELYYNIDLSSNKINYNNSTYTRIGDNNMFGNMGNIKEKSYNYDKSQSFAYKHGYAILPTQQLLNIISFVYYVPCGNYSVRTEGGVETIINEKYTIININYKIKREKMDLLPSKNLFLDVVYGLLGKYERTFRIYYEYEESINKIENKNININDGYSHEFYNSWEDYKSRSKRKNLLQYKERK